MLQTKFDKIFKNEFSHETKFQFQISFLIKNEIWKTNLVSNLDDTRIFVETFCFCEQPVFNNLTHESIFDRMPCSYFEKNFYKILFSRRYLNVYSINNKSKSWVLHKKIFRIDKNARCKIELHTKNDEINV